MWQARMQVDSAHLASFDGHIDITQFLVKCGTNVAGQDVGRLHPFGVL